MRLVRLRKWIVRSLLLILTPAFLVVGWNFVTANFGTIEPGRAYRSGQMHAWGLARTVRDHRIKTVLNLRGHHPDQDWYRAERDATLASGAEQVDIAMSSCEWMSRTQLRTLVDVLQTSETPILIHCWRGAERTGLTTAFLTLLRDGSTLEDARAAFSLEYLFVRAGDGVVTIEHFEQYEAWLRTNGLSHSPIVFRRWVNEGYVPGQPSRENWPYDPYPLAVFTRATPTGPDERKIWDERGRTAGREPETAVR
jgi:protein tyrosine phosphatase (PTP) superfamily phosphohydrolase (DUF442 family)